MDCPKSTSELDTVLHTADLSMPTSTLSRSSKPLFKQALDGKASQVVAAVQVRVILATTSDQVCDLVNTDVEGEGGPGVQVRGSRV
jgi:hypothetical protein